MITIHPVMMSQKRSKRRTQLIVQNESGQEYYCRVNPKWNAFLNWGRLHWKLDRNGPNRPQSNNSYSSSLVASSTTYLISRSIIICDLYTMTWLLIKITFAPDSYINTHGKKDTRSFCDVLVLYFCGCMSSLIAVHNPPFCPRFRSSLTLHPFLPPPPLSLLQSSCVKVAIRKKNDSI